MAKQDKLAEYRRKRDFHLTSEPSGNKKIDGRKKNQFVIQKHDASSLHYDLRLQVDDVFVSWAVPKGPSTDPSEKRLAIRTEDHPLQYGNFEGVIDEGNYGAGTVMIWDRGRFTNLREEKEEDGASMEASLDEGKIEVWLEGEKLQGGYVLIRTQQGEQEQWLLKKMDDDKADARRNPVSTQPNSVVSGRSLDAIQKEASPS
ncbi:MAG TPA: DNA polymerase ligase N-terminal domain-containing protein [Phaeodactylibacter sp.]|nr:DNA polymerase ligase N-terminal domain-containing protein [Phaeodactylibacter sp.]